MLLTDTADECNTTTARFDVADVGREWLQTVACVNAYRSLYAAFHANGTSRTVAAVETAGNEMNTVLLEIDSLLSFVPGFLFGAWIRDAIALGTTTAPKELAASAKMPTCGCRNRGTRQHCLQTQWGTVTRYPVTINKASQAKYRVEVGGVSPYGRK